MRKHEIETYTGHIIDLVNPRPKDVDIKDIARALAMSVRFSGHLDGFMSVATHSINVKRLLQSLNESVEVQMYGLLHDATEAYLGDVVRPLKCMLPSYKKLEKNMMRAILKGLNLRQLLKLTAQQLRQVKNADNCLLLTERYYLKSKARRKHGWTGYNKHHGGLIKTMKFKNPLICYEWKKGEVMFLKEFEQLKELL